MDYPDIGLDLFKMPFGSTPAASKRETQKPQQPKTTVTQPKTPVSSANPHTEIKAQEPTQSQTSVKDSELAHQHPAAKDSKPAQSQTSVKDSESAHPNEKDSELEQSQTVEKAPESTQPHPAAKASGQPQNPQAQPNPQKELSLDMSDHSIPAGKPLDSSEDAKRKAHEKAEAKRKAEWDAKQAAKKQAREAALEKIKSMNDADIVSASTERIRADVERLTRRNMKESVAEHIQNLCRKDPAFARKTMLPHKSMTSCFYYINRQARDYIRNEMEYNEIKPENGIYGGDVPDDLCYQWAEDYFNDMDAPEDKEKEETFTPRPYVGSSASKPKKTDKAKNTAKKEPKKKQEAKKNDYQQMSFMEVL